MVELAALRASAAVFLESLRHAGWHWLQSGRSEAMGLSRLRAHLVPVLISTFVQGCASVSAHGIIKTPDGNPVIDALLTLTEPETGKLAARSSSDLRGCFSVYEPVKSGDRPYVLHILSPGHKSLDLTVRMHEKPLFLVTLAGDKSPDESAFRPILPRERNVLYDIPCVPVRGGGIGLR